MYIRPTCNHLWKLGNSLTRQEKRPSKKPLGQGLPIIYHMTSLPLPDVEGLPFYCWFSTLIGGSQNTSYFICSFHCICCLPHLYPLFFYSALFCSPAIWNVLPHNLRLTHSSLSVSSIIRDVFSSCPIESGNFIHMHITSFFLIFLMALFYIWISSSFVCLLWVSTLINK